MACLRLSFFLFLIALFFAPSLRAQDYVVGEGDIIRVSVYEHPDLTTLARIGGEGMIVLPLVGQVKVAGLSITDVIRKITALLSDGYIVNPQVLVFVEEYRSQKVTIMGQVSRPGLYELRGHTTFLELLSKAGDLSREAGDKAVIKRKANQPDTRESIITVDLKRLIELGETSRDIPVLDGDAIYIMKAGLYYIMGEVRKPDAYKHEKDTTLIKAVTIAGGFSDKAAPGRVRIIRKKDGSDVTLEKVKMDEPIFPEDIIFVPESFF